MTAEAQPNHKVRFKFDPACPWAWRTSLWIREARERRPIEVEWGLLSLEYVNRDQGENEYSELMRRSRPAMRLLHLARREAGNDAIDRLYLALGRARHERDESLSDPETLAAGLAEAGLDPALLERAQPESELDEELREEYETAEATGAFGVPTLYLDEDERPYFGPVIDPVPEGEEAAALWDHLAGMAKLPYFYELKRPRD
jgi:2-hydroxychromene-2-carboxylate isomerase